MRTQQSNARQWVTLCLASLVLAGFTWFYATVVRLSPSHRTYGAFIVSGQAASQHEDPYAVRSGVWPIRPYRGGTGPTIYDRNLQPPILLPVFQLFAKLSIPTGSRLYMWGSALIFIFGTVALMRCFPATVGPPLILLLLLSESTLVTLSTGQDHALLFGLSVAAVCYLQRGKQRAAYICIGVLVALHPNFGLWPVLLFAAGYRWLASRAAAVASALTVLPALVYGPRIYVQLIHAVLTDNHSYLMDDVSLTGIFTRAGLRAVGLALSAAGAIALVVLAKRRGGSPIQLGGVAACGAVLFSPLGWFTYLLVAFPCFAERRLDRFAAVGCALMFIWDRAWYFTGHGFVGLCGSIQFIAATCLFLISFVRATEACEDTSSKGTHTAGATQFALTVN